MAALEPPFKREPERGVAGGPLMLFSVEDIKRATIKWWQWPLLWFVSTRHHIVDGYVYYFKVWRGKSYLVRVDDLREAADA